MGPDLGVENGSTGIDCGTSRAEPTKREELTLYIGGGAVVLILIIILIVLLLR